ncbi:serine hydrolase [Kinneretia aquatilis]|uniref:serine hydrolase n=1 Tax=Kinneretia aquatilis TaxID=2070761 RepID=UPI00149518D2|nr:serine hydrolase [Paucibacter aquatile]WIV98076.1 serine hydrolase [Paucibacter aquatile]
MASKHLAWALSLALIGAAPSGTKAFAPTTVPSALAGFEQDVEKIRQDWQVPGVAVVIVQGDQTLYAKGFGWRDVARRLPMTADTLMPIGSASKAFTTALMAGLVEEGKLAWDQPVQRWLPEFKLHDRVAGERLTPLDLVTHRSGLPRHDALWYNAQRSRQDLLHRLQYLEPSKDLRAAFQYNNLLFMVAGHLTERVSGQSWESHVTQRLLQPLGMRRSNFSVEQTREDADFSQPYRLAKNGEPQQVAFRALDAMNPAGGLITSANEMAAWLRLHLNKGRFEGRQVLSAASINALQQAHISTSAESSPEVIERGYTPGWFSDVYRGHLRLHHGGKIDGFSAMVMWLPQAGVGVAVLSNLEGSPVREFIARNAVDRLLKLEVRDGSAQALQARAAQKLEKKKGSPQAPGVRKAGTQASHPLSAYLGDCEHPAYGTVSITERAGGLHMSLNGNGANLVHWHHDSFVGESADAGEDAVLAKQRLQFLTDRDGEPGALQMALEPAVKDVVFQRKKEAHLRDPAFLKKLTGTFVFDGQREFSIGLQDDALYAEMAGRPRYVLQPVRGYRFELQGLSGFSIEFKPGKDGLFNQAEIARPGSSSWATRK